ncbi:MAG TPA: PAS domain-containing protein [Actinomycetota bacterium]|nr:PAS domain-containing protein [Actinomycetota bacterium]
MAEPETVVRYVYWYSDDPAPPALRELSGNAEEVFGYPMSSWNEDPYLWQRLLHPEDAETAIAATWRSTLDGVPYDITYRMVTRDSRLLWIRDVAEVEVVHGDADGGELWRGTWTVVPEPAG